MNKETHLQLLRKLEKNPELTQRQLAAEMGVSLGKLNYCLKKLVESGWVKVNNFHKNPNKRSYGYLLTPSGVEEKAQLTVQFLKRKVEEYDQLQEEIKQLVVEVNEAKKVGLNKEKESR